MKGAVLSRGARYCHEGRGVVTRGMMLPRGASSDDDGDLCDDKEDCDKEGRCVMTRSVV